jgi:hypothetical protein
MEKTARRPSTDPVQERLRQNKASWNKEVSTFINDLIHFKKTMNGWPSKFFKERSRITTPIPADPATIIGSLSGDFQELVNKGNSVIQEQLEYAKNRRQRQPKQLNLPLPEPGKAPPAAEAPKPQQDLSKQLSLGLEASIKKSELIKLAIEMEEKYSLESQASNPVTRFVTRLFNPKYGFGEAARMRRLRMTMLDNCAKAYKTLKALHKEIVKSSGSSIESSHKMMTSVWNYWNIVNRLFSSYKALRPGEVKEPGGVIEDPESRRQRAIDEGRDPEEVGAPPGEMPTASDAANIVQDYQANANYIGAISKNPQFGAFVSAMEQLKARPKSRKPTSKELDALQMSYNSAVGATNQELGTSGQSFKDIVQQHKSLPQKQAQSFGKTRHQLIPGATSGARLEVYNLIETLRQDLDAVMDLLEAGFDQEKLSEAISKVNRQMSALRTMTRALYFSEKPEMASNSFF